jgi:hypothetical protein
MTRLALLALAVLAVLGSTGCSCFRAVDQWKCDRLGICCFGVQPSCPQPYAAPCPPPELDPTQPYYPAPQPYVPAEPRLIPGDGGGTEFLSPN